MGNSFSKKLKLKKNITNKFETTILHLPNEILVQIFSELPQRDILNNVALVCRRFFEITRLQKTLPIIKVRACFSLRFKMIESLKFYPGSLINVDLGEVSCSKLETLYPYAPLLHALSIIINSDERNVEIPVFENLKKLTFLPGRFWQPCCISNSFGLWEKFPNLSTLKVQLVACRDHVSFKKDCLFSM